MRKPLILTLILIFGYSELSFCQNKDRTTTVGLTYQPFTYWGYNKGESTTFKQKVIKPRGFNGIGFGVFTKFKLFEQISLRADLIYTKQRQQYKFSGYDGSGPLDTIVHYRYEDDRKNSFQIIKLPLIIEFNQEIIYKSGFIISGFAGPQISYLHSYKLELFQHPNESVLDENGVPTGDVRFLLDSIHNYARFSKKQFYQKEYFTTGKLVEVTTTLPKAFHDFTVGAVAGIELSKTLFEFLFISLGGRFEYDFTNMEKSGAEGVSFIFKDQLPGNKRLASHHVRAGFNLSVGYKF